MNILIFHIIKQLTDIQKGKIWIGENFNIKLKNVHPEIAFKRPSPTLHAFAEIISHLTVWRNETILKIKTGKGSIIDDLEDNWFGIEHLKKIGWDHLLTDFNNSLEELIQLLESKNDAFLNEIYYDTDYKRDCDYLFLIEGMLHHDIYHLGQIGIVLKMIKKETHKLKII